MSKRPARRLSTISTENPSVNDSCACGSASRNDKVKGTVTSLDKLGGKPMETRPAKEPRTEASSSWATVTWCKMPRPCASITKPASVTVTPRPLRRSKFWCSSTSSWRTCRLSKGCGMPKAAAALVKLPNSATRTNDSICLSSMIRPGCKFFE